MKIIFQDRILTGDAMHSCDVHSEKISRYSEWHHFNFNDNKNKLYGIFNLSLSGNIKKPNLGRAGLSLVVYEMGKTWRGTMDLHAVEKVSFEPGLVDLKIGNHFVQLRKNKFYISGALKDESIILKAMWTPQTKGIRITNIGGIINTFIIPRLKVEGSIWIDKHEHKIDGASGYHDHNWGYWDWGQDIGWDWGYIVQPSSLNKNKRNALTIVFGQVTDATRKKAQSNLVLLIWHGMECKHVFLDDAIEMSTESDLKGVEIRRVPGLMALLYPGQLRQIPQHIYISAKDGDDVLNIKLYVENAIQFLIPHPANTGKTIISELVGKYSVQGRLNGCDYNFSYVGFAEVTS